MRAHRQPLERLVFLDGAGQDKLWFSVPGLKLELIR